MTMDLFCPIEKRPRQYAADIFALPKSERESAIAEVPEIYRNTVISYLCIFKDQQENERFASTQRALDGAQQAADHADAVHGDWSERAYQLLKRYPGRKFMAEEVAKWAYDQGLPKPPTGRAWGAVINRAKKEKIIRHIGYDRVSNPNAHSTPASVWEKAA